LAHNWYASALARTVATGVLSSTFALDFTKRERAFHIGDRPPTTSHFVHA
jgi:hypothetical protein